MNIKILVILFTLALILLNVLRYYYRNEKVALKIFLDFIPIIIPISCMFIKYKDLSIMFKIIASLNIMVACTMLAYYFYDRKFGKYLLSPVIVSIVIISKFIW
ncbi:MAG: hypothetical protein RR673_04740 [Erysipelotrichaceae bacterium]